MQISKIKNKLNFKTSEINSRDNERKKRTPPVQNGIAIFFSTPTPLTLRFYCNYVLLLALLATLFVNLNTGSTDNNTFTVKSAAQLSREFIRIPT